MKKARRNSADMVIFGRKTAAPFVADCLGEDVIEPSLVMKTRSLVPEECGSLEEQIFVQFVEESPLKQRKVFRPANIGRIISRACVQALL